MKKAFKWEKIAIAGTVATALLAGVTPVFADPLKVEDDTTTEIGFVEGEHKVPESQNGKLDLIWVPKNLSFGLTRTVDMATKKYQLTNAAGADDNKSRYCVVRDQRGAGAAVWTLSAKATELKPTTGSGNLVGAKYYIGEVAVGKDGWKNKLKSYTSATDADSPDTSGSIFDFPGATTVTVNSAFVLETDGTPVTVMESGSTVVDGKYAAELNHIYLEVAAGTSQEGKKYEGTIHWSLDSIL